MRVIGLRPFCTVRLLVGLAVLGWVQWTAAQSDPAMERRMQAMESMQIERRLTAMETRLESIETIGRGVIVVVVAQLVLGGLAMRKGAK